MGKTSTFQNIFPLTPFPKSIIIDMTLKQFHTMSCSKHACAPNNEILTISPVAAWY